MQLQFSDAPLRPHLGWGFVVDGPPVELVRGGPDSSHVLPRSRRYVRIVRAHALVTRPHRWPRNGRYRVVLELFHPDRSKRDDLRHQAAILAAIEGVAWWAARSVDVVARHHVDRDAPRIEVNIEHHGGRR